MPLILAPDTVVTVDPPVTPVIQVSPPAAPTVSVAAPTTPNILQDAPVNPSVVTVPLIGPPGPTGPRGPAGVSTNASCVWPVPLPVYLVQVIHTLGFYPAGVTAMDTSGNPVEYAKLTYVSTDIAEISFDVLFSGTIYLS